MSVLLFRFALTCLKHSAPRFTTLLPAPIIAASKMLYLVSLPLGEHKQLPVYEFVMSWPLLAPRMTSRSRKIWPS
jgi:hypothetical protein